MMYKTIFTTLTDAEAENAALSYAVEMTAAQDAHLDVLCMGMDRSPTTYYEIGSNAVIMHAAIEEAHARAAEIHNRVENALAPEGIRWESRNTVAPTWGIGHAVSCQARFADLAIVALPYAEGQPRDAQQVLEGLLFESDCPCIVVPPAQGSARPRTIAIAWNESNEAMRAVRAALPLLTAAKTVHIAIIDPSDAGPERSDPGGGLAVFLARHGVSCDIQVMTRQGLSISDRLSQYILETGSDMLVMGGYGHSRLREAVLGGATRDTLEHSKVPVFMAH